jgi:hypothetical protein
MKPIRLLRAGVITGIVLSILILSAVPVSANMGVGVDLAEIKVDEVLTPGNSYHLPAVGVINTGDQTADYEVVITYLTSQPELMPSAGWFRFEPRDFSLEAGISRKVSLTLHLPRDAAPGDYFALIEAHPVVVGSGGAAIAVAAATKLRFSVKKINGTASALDAIGDFFRSTAPYCYIVLGGLGAVIVIWLLRRFFRFRFKLERR